MDAFDAIALAIFGSAKLFETDDVVRVQYEAPVDEEHTGGGGVAGGLCVIA